MKVVHHIKSLGFGGTEKVAMTFAKYLAEDPDYEVYLLYPDGSDTTRLPFVSEKVRTISYKAEYRQPCLPPYIPHKSNICEVLHDLQPDVLHVNRSGYFEFPVLKGLYPEKTKVVETNIFGYNDPSRLISKHLYISNFIKRTALNAGGPDGPILYNPIELPFYRPNVCTKHTILCEELEIPYDSIILGRIGRPDNFTPIALKAFKILVAEFPNLWYAVVGACQGFRDFVEREKIPNIKYVPPLISDEHISLFLQAIDIYAHYRCDGECNSVAIGEAMLHRLPIVSHYGQTYNGHLEQLVGCGFVVPQNDYLSYVQVLRELIIDESLRLEFGELAYQHGVLMHDPIKITKQLKQCYNAIM